MSTIFSDLFQKAVLQQAYAVTPFPNRPERERLGAVLNRDERSVQIWFQNQRRMDKANGTWLRAREHRLQRLAMEAREQAGPTL
jgi:hypothetical protein